mgnify:CR=1 FL=1
MKYLKLFEDYDRTGFNNNLINIRERKYDKKEKESLRDYQIRTNTEKKPEKWSDTPEEFITGKEIINSVSSGVYYHGSHIPTLTKENVKLFSKGSDIGNIRAGDRFGFYITSNIKTAFNYSSAWVEANETGKKLEEEGYKIVESLKKKSLIKDSEWQEDKVYGPPYSHIEDFAKKIGKDNSFFYDLRIGDEEHWDLYAILAAVKRGFWPTIYKVKLNPEDKYIPKLDLEIDHDEVAKYTKSGAVGIYNGKLGGNKTDKRDEIAILNRHAISDMSKLDDNAFDKARKNFYTKKSHGDLNKEMWDFAKKLLNK